MPNWIENHVFYDGNEAEIQEMLENIKNDVLGKGTIDFNKIIPMPESLNIECGSRTDKGIEAIKQYLDKLSGPILQEKVNFEGFKDFLNKHCDEITDENEKEIWKLGVTAVSNIHEYGSPTWYEWAINNWGTKWNACGYESDTDYSNNGMIWLQTAWSAPKPIFQKLSELYPNVEFRCQWADEDLGANCGERTYKNGEIISEDIPRSNREAMEFAAKVWDYDLSDFSLHLNQTGDEYIYTGDDKFELIEIFGKPALFANERLTPSQVPMALNLYHLRQSDDGERFATIEPKVAVNHGGSIITRETLDFGEDGYIELTEETEPNFIGNGQHSIDDYISENYRLDTAESEDPVGGMQL